MSRRRLVAGILLLVIGLPALLHVTRAAVSPIQNPGREDASIRTLARALDAGAGAQMQALFPEVEFFTWLLTGLSAARLAESGHNVDANLAVVTAAVANTGRPEVAEHFGSNHRGVPHGAFYHGWRLLLLVEQARVTGDARQLATVQTQAADLLAALDAPDEPPLTSYPGQAWPCDLVVAWAAVHRADELSPVTGLAEATGRLLAGIDAWRDPETGLIGHQFQSGSPLQVSGARGSSQAIINSWLREIDAGLADREWAGFTEQFVDAQWGLVGVREYPKGHEVGTGDVDSGPLLAGVSLSASAVALGAARANADIGLAKSLHSQAELLGLPLPWLGDRGLNGRAFAFGVLPVGDAFVATSRTQPVGIVTTSGQPDHPHVAWWAWFGLALLPALIGVLLLSRRSRTARR